jgi:hypothetical protein
LCSEQTMPSRDRIRHWRSQSMTAGGVEEVRAGD